MTHWLDGPVLFLDIDGVLNSHAYAKRVKQALLGIDPDAVALLQRIVDATGCTLVLSSTWRKLHSLADMRGRLIAAGMRSPVPLRDKTPSLERERPSGVYEAVLRGDEVKKWIEDRDFTGRYVCLDDDGDFLPGQPLVQTSFDKGLTTEEVARCIDILGARMETLPSADCDQCAGYRYISDIPCSACNAMGESPRLNRGVK